MSEGRITVCEDAGAMFPGNQSVPLIQYYRVTLICSRLLQSHAWGASEDVACMVIAVFAWMEEFAYEFVI